MWPFPLSDMVRQTSYLTFTVGIYSYTYLEQTESGFLMIMFEFSITAFVEGGFIGVKFGVS